MIEPKDFPHLRYFCFPQGNPKSLENIIGLDTEAYEDGKPFLCMLSTGREIDLHTFPQDFFSEVPEGIILKTEYKKIAEKSLYLNKHYGTYNLKYDSGACLYFMDRKNLMELWKYGHTIMELAGGVSLSSPDLTRGEVKRYAFDYIPHKYLCIQHKGFYIKIWDIAQYFKMSLDSACKVYLGRAVKLEMETKTFSVEYVKKHFEKIKKYCLVDSQACAELGNYLISKLKEFGIKTTSLYSAASLSYEYFSSRCHIVVIKRFWKYYKELINYSLEAYRGGKFECTGRGVFNNAWQYDIVSAYPFQISRLLDFEKARVVFSSEYIGEADYGFLRVMVCNDGQHIPVAVKNKSGVDIYPQGKFFATITKQEYDYCMSIGVDCRIISGYWLVCKNKVTPYKDCIDELFSIKAKYKGKDDFLYEISKKMMNSFYGKTLQIIKEIVIDTDTMTGSKNGVPVFGEKNIYKAGRSFNPVHGAIVTAETRIQITKIQNLLKTDCLAVHTDSALCLRELPPELTTGKLGELELQKRGGGVLIACGQYQINTPEGKSKGAYKGFKPDYDDNWLDMLSRNKERSTIEQKVLMVEGWYECCAKKHFDSINLFQESKKIIDLNADTKRLWARKVKAKNLLQGIEQSTPIVTVNLKKPLNW